MNGNNQWEWEGNGNKTRLNLGLGMGMGINHWEWEGIGLEKIFPLISSPWPIQRFRDDVIVTSLILLFTYLIGTLTLC